MKMTLFFNHVRKNRFEHLKLFLFIWFLFFRELKGFFVVRNKFIQVYRVFLDKNKCLCWKNSYFGDKKIIERMTQQTTCLYIYIA